MFEEYYVDVHGVQKLKRIDVTQADAIHAKVIHLVELRGADFPLDEAAIKDIIALESSYSILLKLDHVAHAWATFAVQDDNIYIARLVVRDETELTAVMNALMETITWTPATPRRNSVVTIVWPEHATDRPVFKHLLKTGWLAVGLEHNRYTAYGSCWDGILLRKTF